MFTVSWPECTHQNAEQCCKDAAIVNRKTGSVLCAEHAQGTEDEIQLDKLDSTHLFSEALDMLGLVYLYVEQQQDEGPHYTPTRSDTLQLVEGAIALVQAGLFKKLTE